MPFAASINFRASSGWVADSAGQTYCGGDLYTGSVIRDGLTFGWLATVSAADRINGTANDPEFSGFNYSLNQSAGYEFRLDLPAAGTYSVRLALGDYFFSQFGQFCSIRDGPAGALLATVCSGTTVAANHFLDATGVERTGPADWRTNNAAVSVTTTGPSLVVRIGDATDGNNTLIAHLEVAEVVSGTAGQLWLQTAGGYLGLSVS